MTIEIPDSIERSIVIDAPVEQVWALVSEPGWFINDGELREHRLERTGDLTVVHDPVHGAFPFRTVALEPPRYIAFRFEPEDQANSAGDFPPTHTEFWIEPLPEGGVTLRLSESGFAAQKGDPEKLRASYDANCEAWELELALAKRVLEGNR